MRDITVDAFISKSYSDAIALDGWRRVGRELLNGLSAHSGIGLRVPSRAHPEPWAILTDSDQNAAAEHAEHWDPLDPCRSDRSFAPHPALPSLLEFS